VSRVTPGVDPAEIKRILEDFFNKSSDGSLITSHQLWQKIVDGKAFSVSHRFTNIASNAEAVMVFVNPADSDKTAYIVAVEVITMAQAWVDVFHDNDITDIGTRVTPVNLNLGSNNTSAMQVGYNGSYTEGVQAVNIVCPGGSHIRAIGGATEVGESVVIPPGKNILVKVTNKSASAQDLSIRILWWED